MWYLSQWHQSVLCWLRSSQCRQLCRVQANCHHVCTHAYTHAVQPLQAHPYTGQTHFCVCAHKRNSSYSTHKIYSTLASFQSGISRQWGDIAPYHSSLANPLVVSQTCVLCFNRGENRHIVEQGFGTAQVCCWIWGRSITATASQRRLGLGLICNHREGKERTLSCAIAINNPHTGIINHQ